MVFDKVFILLGGIKIFEILFLISFGIFVMCVVIIGCVVVMVFIKMMGMFLVKFGRIKILCDFSVLVILVWDWYFKKCMCLWKGVVCFFNVVWLGLLLMIVNVIFFGRCFIVFKSIGIFLIVVKCLMNNSFLLFVGVLV